MPYRTEWIEPEVFLTHKGITVYHCYNDDDFDDCLHYWYTTSDQDDHTCDFDVRELPTYHAICDDECKDEDEGDREVIIDAIDRGILTAGGLQKRE
jgi:hypothetical protein